MTKVFLSYNSKDQPVVEPIALALRELLGEDQVFYDAWSINPTDGIIDKMNQGLEGQDFFIWFLSRKSLASGPVQLEWQSALFKAAYQSTKFCVVRLDDCDVPAILAHKVYIDMCNEGLEIATAKILNVVKGESTFEPKHKNFKNLTCAVEKTSDSGYKVTVTAEILKEPNPQIEFWIACAPDSARVSIEGAQSMKMEVYSLGMPELRAFITKDTGSNGAIYPSKPITYLISPKSEAPIKLVAVMVRNSNGDLEPISPILRN